MHTTTPMVPCSQWTHAQEEVELFGPEVPAQLREPWALTTPALAKIDEDGSWLLSSTAQVLSETLGLPASLCTHTACMRVRTQCLPVAFCFSAPDLCPPWPVWVEAPLTMSGVAASSACQSSLMQEHPP